MSETPPASRGDLLRAGQLFLRLQLPSKALQCFDLAQSRPGHETDASAAQLSHNRGVALHALHRPAPAAEAFAEALRLSPGCGEARLNLGALRMRAGQLDEAREHFARLLEEEEGALRQRARWNLATVLRQQGRGAQALALGRQALAEESGVEALSLPGLCERRAAESRGGVQVCCVKWGAKYGPDYVNKLRRAVARHLEEPHRFHCFTDQAQGLDADMEVHRLEEPSEAGQDGLTGWWTKLALFRGDDAFPDGAHVVYFDLDVVITGDLTPLTRLDPDMRFHALRTDDLANERRRDGINSSVMVWRHPEMCAVYDFAVMHLAAIQRVTYKMDHFLELLLHPIFLQDVWASGIADFHAVDAADPSGDSVANVVIFPLSPKPHEVPEHPVVAQHWR